MDKQATFTAQFSVPDRIIRYKEVERITGLKRSALYKLMNNGRFPLPRKLTNYSNGWILSEVMRWMEELPKADLVRETGD